MQRAKAEMMVDLKSIFAEEIQGFNEVGLVSDDV